MVTTDWSEFDPALLARNIGAREAGVVHPETCGPCEDCAEYLKQQGLGRGYRLPGASTPTLKQYTRHGRLYGTEMIYETAVETGLPILELRRLKLELDTIDAAKGRSSSRPKRTRGGTGVAVRLLAERGLTRREIALALDLKDKTADNHLSPGRIEATNHLRAAVSGMKTPAKQGGENGQIGLSDNPSRSAAG